MASTHAGNDVCEPLTRHITMSSSPCMTAEWLCVLVCDMCCTRGLLYPSVLHFCPVFCCTKCFEDGELSRRLLSCHLHGRWQGTRSFNVFLLIQFRPATHSGHVVDVVAFDASALVPLFSGSLFICFYHRERSNRGVPHTLPHDVVSRNVVLLTHFATTHRCHRTRVESKPC